MPDNDILHYTALKSFLRNCAECWNYFVEQPLREVDIITGDLRVRQIDNIQRFERMTELLLLVYKESRILNLPSDPKALFFEANDLVDRIGQDNTSREETRSEAKITLGRLIGDAEALLERTFRQTCSHSEDFGTVTWFGTQYDFNTTSQRTIVSTLWREWDEGRGGVTNEFLQTACGSESSSFKVKNVFRSSGGHAPGHHPAWNTMIQPIKRNLFALCAPK